MLDRNLLKLEGMKGILGALAILALLQAAAIAFQALALASAVTALWEGSDVSSQVSGILAFLACFALRHILLFAQETMLDRYAVRTSSDLRSKLLALVFDRDATLARKIGTASVAVSATEGVDEIREYIRVIPPKAVGIAAISIPLLAFVFSIDLMSGIILLVMLPAIVLFMILLGRQARERAAKRYESYRRLSNRFIDTLRGLQVIESFGAGDVEGASVFSFSERLRKATIATLSTATLSSAVLDLFATFGLAAVSIMMAFRLMDGTLALQPALCVLVLAPEFFSPIRAFASDFHASLNGKNALESFLGILECNSEDNKAERDSDFTNASYESNVCSCALDFEDVTYTYDGAHEPALTVEGFHIAQGEHVAVVGPSGSGKSTFAALAAGLIPPDSGHVKCFGEDSCTSAYPTVRFVPQNPYIFRASLLDNIRFYVPDASRESVERTCSIVGLDQLISSLPDGLDTLVGEGARGLSGGQAHRVALARIVLDERARVLVFDEPTAHLDIETELELKERLLPLLEGRTVLFATHRRHWINDMDRVITLEGGRIVDDKVVNKAEIATPSDVLLHSAVEAETATRCDDKPETCASCPDGETTSHSDNIDNDLKATWLRGQTSRYRRSVIVAIALGLVSAAFAALLMFTSGYLISATATPGVTLFSILLPIAFVQVFGLGKPIAHYLERLVSHDWVLRITSVLRSVLYRVARLHSSDPARVRSTGEYLSILDDDIAHFQNLYLRVVFPIAIAYVLAIITVIFVGTFSISFALVLTLSLALLIVAVPLIAFKANRRNSRRVRSVRSHEYESIADDVMGAVDWMLARRGDFALAAHERACEDGERAGFRVRLVNRASSLAVTLGLGICSCMVIAWAGNSFSGSLPSANYIAAFTLGFFPLIDHFSRLPEAFSRTRDHADAIARLERFGSSAADASGTAHHADDTDAGSSESPMSADSKIVLEFKDVTYRYPHTGRPVLDHVKLSVPKGQRVAVLGRSGSGKTTLALIAQGALKPDSGTATVFGSDAAKLHGRMPLHVGFLPQKPYLFDRTIRENLLLGVADDDDAALIAALHQVGLGDKIDALPQGLDTPIGETGMGFSGGEAHRIALARLLVADAPIIIVDEPFSALDTETERSLLETLLAVSEERTLIVITHHLQGIEKFDRVLFVEDGNVTVDDTPEHLMQHDPRFRSLVTFDAD